MLNLSGQPHDPDRITVITLQTAPLQLCQAMALWRFNPLIGFLCNLWTLNLGLGLSLSSTPFYCSPKECTLAGPRGFVVQLVSVGIPTLPLALQDQTSTLVVFPSSWVGQSQSLNPL